MYAESARDTFDKMATDNAEDTLFFRLNEITRDSID